MKKNGSYVPRLVGLLLLIGGVLWFLNSISWLVGLLLISGLIVYILQPPALYLKKRFKLSHSVSVILVFLLFLLFCLLCLSLFIPVVYYEGKELADNLPHYAARFQTYLYWLSQQLIDLEVEEEVRSYLVGLPDYLYQVLEYIAEASLSLLSSAVDFFIVMFLVFYLLHDFQAIRGRLLDLVPTAHLSLAEDILTIIDVNVGTFIRGSLIRCFVVGLVTGVVLLIAGMPYAFLLGLIAGIFNFVLYIGPYIAAVPALLLSLSPLTPSPVIVIIIYVTIQILDGMFLAPVVLGRIIKLKPITIIVAILAGGSLAGLLGMLIAVPLAGIINNLLDLLKGRPVWKDAGEGEPGKPVSQSTGRN